MERAVDVLMLVWINLLLSGDNALVIAMATRHLPRPERRLAVAVGTAGAVVLRVTLTAFAAGVLYRPYVQAVAGLLLIWIAVKLLVPAPEGSPGPDRGGGGGWVRTVGTILLADVSMSLDNVLAIATAARGDLGLLTAGLALSIPLIVWGSGLVRRLIDWAPWLLWAGAGLLGWIGGGMLARDPAFGLDDGSPAVAWWAAALAASAVLIVGTWRKHIRD
ncbi:MAG: TerC family protein [Alicyclobacillaceae bacterium]|nr:TerC family protein [Alicyclobacillaceae bacterium]